MYICVYMYDIHDYIHMYMYTPMCIYTYMYTYIQGSLSLSLNPILGRVHILAHTNIHTYTHTHTHMYTNTQPSCGHTAAILGAPCGVGALSQVHMYVYMDICVSFHLCACVYIRT